MLASPRRVALQHSGRRGGEDASARSELRRDARRAHEPHAVHIQPRIAHASSQGDALAEARAHLSCRAQRTSRVRRPRATLAAGRRAVAVARQRHVPTELQARRTWFQVPDAYRVDLLSVLHLHRLHITHCRNAVGSRLCAEAAGGLEKVAPSFSTKHEHFPGVSAEFAATFSLSLSGQLQTIRLKLPTGDGANDRKNTQHYSYVVPDEWKFFCLLKFVSYQHCATHTR